ncbi:shikimate dehydrogenase [Dehalogenimonas etheniformans]|uniref:Shikimate dehydrogenase (NADP(+)) n=1 Tax=Dehalogenimonas etheniformans TaxID=1536648 RepID=A0A2P5P7H0_9CHLR|nr:shikimate dehydrogenase [Dehalogenimonas etheniformans]PPD58242.1 shikimate dehydrogenase [Dehalogenimonas etheniformans]QNT75651.1 shikimate dehydrogenase [Dehalogenimonas etheniformans]
MIDENTRMIALLGNPVAQSVSPAMQNAAFRALEQKYIYLAFQVPPAALGEAINVVRGLGFRGANITIPHKTTVIPLLDNTDPHAKRIGAVNTVLNENGKLTGYNTDAPGFLVALRRGGFEPKGEKAVVLGAGGAARAVVFALRDAGTTIAIINRSHESAVNLARETESSSFELSESGLRSAMAGSSLVVNTTSLGMSPNAGSTPLPVQFLRQGLFVFDTVYRPRQTRLLREAEAAGCKILGGLEMLVEQGALAFELWTGKTAPRDVMRQAAAEALS